ncbi:MAG: polysaccharide biosynthesis/export family protein [Bacteroidales bacterium]|nr:polysaccharide biosynthesis/export family protein [Bacteroidales bacterium]MCF8327587.1 polysaccharide biosynthesis/export family protein [Bacteroidales bacterium]
MRKNKLSLKLALWLVMFAVLASCTPQKKMIYLQDKAEDQATTYDTMPSPYLLKKGDMVYLDIQTFNLESKEFLQKDQSNNMRGGNTQNSIGDPSLYVNSYAINDTGYVKMPVLGAIKLSGLTVAEANQVIQDHVDLYLNNATVQLRLINFKVSLLGEVNQPGTYYVYQPSVNILELISNAGDMTPYGNRQEVMIVRTINGKEKSIFLDLTNRNVLNSPFFYLQPGDVVYVQPNRLAKTTGFATIPWGTIFSAVSSTILIINFLQ